MIKIPDEPTEVPRELSHSRVERTLRIIDNQEWSPHHKWPRMPLAWQPDWPTGWSYYGA